MLEFDTGEGPSALNLVSEQILINAVVAVGIGWSVLPNLRLGVSLAGNYNELYGAFILHGGNVTPDPANPGDGGDLAGFATSFGRRAAGLGLRVGVQWEPHPNWVLATAVWSPAYGGTAGIDFDSARGLAPDEPQPDIRFRSALSVRLAYGRGDLSTFVFDPDFGGETASVPARSVEAALYLSAGLYL